MKLWVKWKHREGELLPGFNPASPADVLRWQGWDTCGTCKGNWRGVYGRGRNTTYSSESCPDCAHGLVPPAGMVEAAAIGLYEAGDRWGKSRSLTSWADAGDHYRDWITHQARAALVAAARWEKS